MNLTACRMDFFYQKKFKKVVLRVQRSSEELPSELYLLFPQIQLPKAHGWVGSGSPILALACDLVSLGEAEVRASLTFPFPLLCCDFFRRPCLTKAMTLFSGLNVLPM